MAKEQNNRSKKNVKVRWEDGKPVLSRENNRNKKNSFNLNFNSMEFK